MTAVEHPSTARTAIVTGGSKGLGLAVVRDLAAHGWTVITDARDGATLTGAVAGLRGAIAMPGDVTDPSHRAALVSAAARTGRLDLLVNNAGALGPSPLPRVADLKPGEFAALLQANVVAPAALVAAALPLLVACRGAIVNITSDASVEPYKGWGAYGASKAGLDHLTRVLAVECPDLGVWALDPGDLRTDMHQAAFPGEDISDRPLPETAAPAVRALLAVRPPGGRVRAADVLSAATRAEAPERAAGPWAIATGETR